MRYRNKFAGWESYLWRFMVVRRTFAEGGGRRAEGEGRRAKGEGRRAKGEGRRAKKYQKNIVVKVFFKYFLSALRSPPKRVYKSS